MNEHELAGGVRYVGGKAESAIGGAIDSREWQADGVIDQVAGAAENLYGRAQSVAKDVADAAPGLIDKGRETLGDAADRTIAAARHGKHAVAARVGNDPALWALAAAMGGYAVAWLIHGRRG